LQPTQSCTNNNNIDRIENKGCHTTSLTSDFDEVDNRGFSPQKLGQQDLKGVEILVSSCFYLGRSFLLWD
jgi:hypothetical protein